MRGDLLGSIGLVFLVYTVITTIQKVEAQLQFRLAGAIGRAVLARRFTEYLSVMILGPILLAVALGLLGSRGAQSRCAMAATPLRRSRWS